MIKKADKKYASQVASLHYQTITQGFLTKLGERFLEILYHFLIQHEQIFVYKEDKQILGFISCALSSTSIMRRFVFSSPKGILRILLVLLKNPKLLKQLWETFQAPSLSKSSSEVNLDIPETELLSICVSQKAQQGGIGSKLLHALEIELKRSGINCYKVIAGEKLEGANRFYQKNGFVLVKRISIHGEDISNVYIKELK